MIIKLPYGVDSGEDSLDLEIKTPLDLMDILRDYHQLMLDVFLDGITIQSNQALAEIVIQRNPNVLPQQQIDLRERMWINEDIVCRVDRVLTDNIFGCDRCMVTHWKDTGSMMCFAHDRRGLATEERLRSNLDIIARSKQDLIDRGILTWEDSGKMEWPSARKVVT